MRGIMDAVCVEHAANFLLPVQCLMHAYLIIINQIHVDGAQVDELSTVRNPASVFLARMAGASLFSLPLGPPAITIVQRRCTAEEMRRVTSQASYAAAAAALEQHQRSAGFARVLSAAELHLLALYIQMDTAIDLLSHDSEATLAQQHEWRAAAMSANQQLVELDLSATAYLHLKRACLMSMFQFTRTEAVAAARLSLQAAPEHKCECCGSRHSSMHLGSHKYD